MIILYIYAAIGLTVGVLATWKNRWIFQHGSHRVLRAISHALIVGLLWWLVGPMAFGFSRDKYR
jgi:hypothetical protein